MKDNKKSDALDYHEYPQPGKIAVVPTKKHTTQYDLSLAYSPGVAEPCLAIEENKNDAYRYTNKGNLVAVISNGTAVLGLGNIGADASKPVMEGKGLLFKIFADIDVFDIEVNSTQKTSKSAIFSSNFCSNVTFINYILPKPDEILKKSRYLNPIKIAA